MNDSGIDIEREQNSERNIEYDILLEQPDLSPEVRRRLIEKKYRLPNNVNALKSSLYYDLLDKYHKLKIGKALQNETMAQLTLSEVAKNEEIRKLLEVLLSLFDTVCEIGGEAFSDEHISKSIINAKNLLYRYMPELEERNLEKVGTEIVTNLYSRKDNFEVQTKAMNKEQAAKILKTTVSNVNYVGKTTSIIYE